MVVKNMSRLTESCIFYRRSRLRGEDQGHGGLIPTKTVLTMVLDEHIHQNGRR